MTKPPRLLDHPYYQVNWGALRNAHPRAGVDEAHEWAKRTLKVGDRITASRCGGRSTFTFDGWDGRWLVSRSGRDDIAPICILRINGVHVVNPGIEAAMELAGTVSTPLASIPPDQPQ
jgi:hypothetical protein